MKRTVFLIYGVVSYAVFFVVFLYLSAFLGNFLVPKTIDGPIEVIATSTTDGPTMARPDRETPAPPTTASGGVPAWMVNTGLLLLFAFQHTIMARPAFKKRWTKLVPKEIERSTYVLLSSLLLALMMWLWKPMPGYVFHVTDTPWRELMWGLFALGWLIVLISTFLIDHFELFGLKQVWAQFKGQELPAYRFKTPLFYKWVRHPIYLGWMTAFWATPDFTHGHLLFAFITSLYMVIAIIYEERDLANYFGEDYRAYMTRVSMLIPVPPRKG